MTSRGDCLLVRTLEASHFSETHNSQSKYEKFPEEFSSLYQSDGTVFL